ncbi:MAG: hypothetical protein ABSF18_02605, partial [Gammaproteobacteria bacterium]
MKVKHSQLSITRKLLNRVFIVYIILTVIMTSHEMYTEYLQERSELTDNFTTLEKFIGPALSDA